MGVYSPWLYYIQPSICPIVAGGVDEFLYAAGWDGDYIKAMDLFKDINSIIGENDMGLFDAFLWHTDRWKKIISKERQSKDSGETHDSNVYELLLSKKQVIIYGPPGTGKTFSTKRITVSLIEGVDLEMNLEDSNEAIQGSSDLGKRNIDNMLYNKIEKAINALPGIEGVPRSSMIGYYSVSQKNHKKIGLTWLGYPTGKTGAFTVHLRKPINESYPKNLIKELDSYKANGWGGYPEFKITNEHEADLAIELIKYAYNNL